MAMWFVLQNEALPHNNNPRSFGHVGLGGAPAFGDPVAKLGFILCRNLMASNGVGLYVGPMIDATVSSV
jgi:hypothetical protein